MGKDNFIIITGRAFPRGLRMIGFVGMALGMVLAITESFSLGFIITAISAFFCFNTAGFQAKKGKYRNFIYFLDIKFGGWQTPKYSNITILKKRMGRRTYGGRTHVSVSESFISYEITLLSNSHRQKQKLFAVKDLETAKESTRVLADVLSLKLVQYRPQSTQRNYY